MNTATTLAPIGTGDSLTAAAAKRLVIIRMWKTRADGRGYKQGSATRAKAALEFFMGARAACPEAIPEMMLVMISIGRDPIEFLKD